MDQKIDTVEANLNHRIDAVETDLNTFKIDIQEQMQIVEKALDIEIDRVYQIALENKRNIEMLLIPFNDRNKKMNEEVAKVGGIEKRVDTVETIVGEHSEKIRELQSAIA